jgi:hypothetical protein
MIKILPAMGVSHDEVFYLVSHVGGGWYLRRDLSDPDAREITLYNIKTKEIRKNALTWALNELEMSPDDCNEYGGLSLARRYVFFEGQNCIRLIIIIHLGRLSLGPTASAY